ncbi:MAG: NYN domain-containing protein [Parabacteroides sp.]|nr:NYN domain-containing protein [Parabacteroides sp.]
MENRQISIGIFIDGGYYAKIDEGLKRDLSLQVNLGNLFTYIRQQISTKYRIDLEDCQITESHYFRGRYRVQDANNKHLLFSERKFEDTLIENDVVFHYKHLREVKKNGEITIIEKGIDTWYALETFELTLLRQFEVVVLITGDADHEMIARKLKALKSRVLLLTWNMGKQSSTSPFLKEEVNWHIELSDECAKDKALLTKLCRNI